MFGAYLFDQPHILILAAFFGLLFGFFLRKAHVSRFNVIVGQLLLKDFTVMKVIFTAIIVGGVGVYFMLHKGAIGHLLLSDASLQAAAVGGLVFGVGMAILGYCPGTSIAALADGSRDVLFGILGMLVAIASFAEMYPWIKAHFILTAPHPATLVTATGLPVWSLFLMLAGGAILFFTLLKKSKIELMRGTKKTG